MKNQRILASEFEQGALDLAWWQNKLQLPPGYSIHSWTFRNTACITNAKGVFIKVSSEMLPLLDHIRNASASYESGYEEGYKNGWSDRDQDIVERAEHIGINTPPSL